MLPFEQWWGSTLNNTMNREACLLLARLQGLDRAAKVAFLFTYFGGGIEVEVEAASTMETQWPFALVRKDNRTLFFIGGAPTRDLVNEIIADYARAGSLNFDYNVEQRAVEYGNQILGTPAYRKFEGQDGLRFFGWSFGGVISCYLYQRKTFLPTSPTADIVSYGQPRGVTERFSDRWGYPIRRWWMPNDIVTAMPPHQSEAPGTNTLLWGAISGSLANYHVHPRGGVRLDENGTITHWAEVNPYWTGRTYPLSPIEAWWYSNELQHGHNLEKYASAFTNAINQEPVAVPPQPRPVPSDEPETIRPRERQEIVRRAAQQIAAELAQDNSLVRDFVFTRIPANANQPFRARVSEGTWFVVKAGEVVDVGPGKRVAKRLARQYNRAARGK